MEEVSREVFKTNGTQMTLLVLAFIFPMFPLATGLIGPSLMALTHTHLRLNTTQPKLV